MGTKQVVRKSTERKIDLRNVMIGKKTDEGIDAYILQEKRNGRKVKRGEAGAELIDKGLLYEGIN